MVILTRDVKISSSYASYSWSSLNILCTSISTGKVYTVIFSEIENRLYLKQDTLADSRFNYLMKSERSICGEAFSTIFRTVTEDIPSKS